MRPLTPALMLLVISGCLGAPDALVGGDDEGAAGLVVADDGRMEVDVPVDVVVLGFAPGVADALAARLAPERVEMLWADDWSDVPPNASRPPHAPHFKDGFHAPPLVPTAHYRVQAAGPTLAGAFLSFVRDHEVAPGVHDANAAEDWLAARLDVDPERPSLVLVHGGDVLPEGHAWRYTYANGWLEPVRVFGERAPLLVLDVSAAEDPRAVTRTPAWDDTVLPAVLGGRVEPPQAYDRVLPPSGEATVAALADAVVDATWFRLLHGAAVPVSLAPCHGVTVLVAVRDTAAQTRVPGFRSAEDLVDVDALAASLGNLTADDVHVDVEILHLPADDPALDAALRPGGGALGGTRGGYDALRWWLHTHWDDYWVAHEGCAEYVSVLVLGDAGDSNAGAYSGIAMYDSTTGRRISVSVIPDQGRLAWEGPVSDTYDRIDPPPGGNGAFEAAMYLLAHETGHIMGEHHTHNVQHPTDGRVEHRSWSSVWSAQSYQVGHRNWDYGLVDRANNARNQVGYAIEELHHAGKLDDPRVADALDLVAASRWHAALDALRPVLDA